MTSNMEAYVLFPAWYFFNEDYLGFWVSTKALCIFAAYAFKSYFFLFLFVCHTVVVGFGVFGVGGFYSARQMRAKKIFLTFEDEWIFIHKDYLLACEKGHLLVSSCMSLCTVKLLFNLRKRVAGSLPFCWKFIHWERSSIGIYLMQNNFGTFTELSFFILFSHKIHYQLFYLVFSIQLMR